MLLKLSVKNFAIISDLTVEFKKGLTVLTGETGAGKSLIIDSISLLLGARADQDMIRYGFDSASIQGEFLANDKLNKILEDYNVKTSDKIIITREITKEGKNKVKINDTNISLQTLKDFSFNLAIIHSQNDIYKLFNKDSYLSLIDNPLDIKLIDLKNKYAKALYNYNEKYNTYNKVLKGQNELLKEKEFYEYTVKELDNLNLYKDIDKDLEERISKLSNFDKIKTSLEETLNNLDGQYSMIDMLYNAKSSLEDIESFDNKYNEYSNTLNEYYYNLKDIKSNLQQELDSLDYNEKELNSSIELLNDIKKVEDKYKKNVDELIEYQSDLKLKLEMSENYDEALKEKKDDLIKSFNNLKDIAEKLTNYRKAIAKNIEKGIVKECVDLSLKNTEFEIVFDKVELTDPFNKQVFLENGVDTVDFLISFNKGEPKKPLYKVASGGEMSRVMIAFRSYFSNNEDEKLLVFDEIDTGVDGEVANKIAIKIKDIAKKMQVLSITHTPQVASIGDNHIHIFKEEIDNRTYTRINVLSYNERIDEVASMLSGNNVSVYAYQAAKEMIDKFN